MFGKALAQENSRMLHPTNLHRKADASLGRRPMANRHVLLSSITPRSNCHDLPPKVQPAQSDGLDVAWSGKMKRVEVRSSRFPSTPLAEVESPQRPRNLLRIRLVCHNCLSRSSLFGVACCPWLEDKSLMPATNIRKTNAVSQRRGPSELPTPTGTQRRFGCVIKQQPSMTSDMEMNDICRPALGHASLEHFVNAMPVGQSTALVEMKYPAAHNKNNSGS